jgi:hypothetical protein
MRKIFAIGISVTALALAGQASSFGTVRELGQNAEHERITRSAMSTEGFGARTLDDLAGKNHTFGAVGAPDDPTFGLMSNKAAHCDGGDNLAVPDYPRTVITAEAQLQACRGWILDHLDYAVLDAAVLVDANGQIKDSELSAGGCIFNGVMGRAKCNVLEDLGIALHAAQDFYSHTNWVDTAAPGPTGPTNPVGLGNNFPAVFLDPAGDTPFPQGLISGCYEGFPESSYCTYDGGKLRVRHAVLNKDTKTSPRSLIADNYEKAMRIAAEDSKRKWQYFVTRLKGTYGDSRGGKMACVIRQDSKSGC